MVVGGVAEMDIWGRSRVRRKGAQEGRGSNRMSCFVSGGGGVSHFMQYVGAYISLKWSTTSVLDEYRVTTYIKYLYLWT